MSENGAAIPPDAAGQDASLNAHSLILRLQGFEGPLDLLLDLARAQKVDLANISILALVDQYLAIIEGARRIRLELAADWLVMAAWLAWLKSRLLVPQGVDEAEDTELLAGNLAERLAELQAIRRAAQWLASRPQLGLDIFARGAPEDLTETDRSGLKLDLPGLVRGYIGALRRGISQRRYTPRPMVFWSVQDALKRLGALMGQMPDWTELSSFLPEEPPVEPLARRAALASTLLAGLEMARGGAIALRQDELFGPIMVKRGEGRPAPERTEETRHRADGRGHGCTCMERGRKLGGGLLCDRVICQPEMAHGLRHGLLHITHHRGECRTTHIGVREMAIAGFLGELQAQAKRGFQCGANGIPMSLVQVKPEEGVELCHQNGGDGRDRRGGERDR